MSSDDVGVEAGCALEMGTGKSDVLRENLAQACSKSKPYSLDAFARISLANDIEMCLIEICARVSTEEGM